MAKRSVDTNTVGTYEGHCIEAYEDENRTITENTSNRSTNTPNRLINEQFSLETKDQRIRNEYSRLMAM